MSRGKSARRPTNASGTVSTSLRRSGILGIGVIVFAALAVYHNCFTVPFLMDDVLSIVQNPKIRHVWPLGDALSPSATSLVGGRPIIQLSFVFNYALGGLAVWGYHALNLAIHILAGLTLFGIVRRTLLRPALRERFGPSSLRLALAVAVLWTVHPLQTQAVTYISERCESLMGLFYLLTLYGFIRGSESQRRWRWFMLSAIACLLGMATKEVMVTAPLMVLLYDRTFVSGSFRKSWTSHGRLYLALGSCWLLLGHLMVGLNYRGVGYDQGFTWWSYALTECRTVVDYLWLALWPHPLVFDYGSDAVMWHVAYWPLYMLILALLVTGVLFALVRWPIIGFIGAWFFLILAPSSSVVPVTGQPMAEYRMYLPLAAVVTLCVMGINALLGRRSSAVFLVMAVGLGFLTTSRNQDYRSNVSIWEDTVAKRPRKPRAQYNLGLALGQAGRAGEGIEHLEVAVRIKPDFAEVHNNLGTALAQSGKIEDAIAQYEQALHYLPNFAEAHYNLASTLAQIGKIQDAITQYKEALRYRPDYAEAHNNLGIALYQAGKSEEAFEHFQEAVRDNPNYAEAHSDLAYALEKAGRVPEAIQHYEEALRLRPDLTAARTALARLQAVHENGL